MKVFERYRPIRHCTYGNPPRFWRPEKVDVKNNIHVLTVEQGTKVPRHFVKIDEYTEPEPEVSFKPKSMKEMNKEMFGKENEIENKILQETNKKPESSFKKMRRRPIIK